MDLASYDVGFLDDIFPSTSHVRSTMEVLVTGDTGGPRTTVDSSPVAIDDNGSSPVVVDNSGSSLVVVDDSGSSPVVVDDSGSGTSIPVSARKSG